LSSCRNKNGELPPLATRATLAAWPSGGVDNRACNGSTPHSTVSFQENNQGTLCVTDKNIYMCGW